MSSIEPNDRGDEMNSGEEVLSGLFVARCDGSELFDLGEEVLDQVACLVGIPVEVAGQSAVRLGRDNGNFSGGGQRGEDPGIGIECLVGNQ